MTQDLADFFFHGTAVPGRPQAQLTLQSVVEGTDQEGWHDDIDDIMDIADINAINAGIGCEKVRRLA